MIASEKDLPGKTGWTWCVWDPGADGRLIASHAMPPSVYESVMADLRKRHGPPSPLMLGKCVAEEPLYHFAYGGMAFLDERVISIRLFGGRTIECYAHQGLTLRQEVDRLLGDQQREWHSQRSGPTWVKLRSHWHICCVTIDDLYTLRAALADDVLGRTDPRVPDASLLRQLLSRTRSAIDALGNPMSGLGGSVAARSGLDQLHEIETLLTAALE